MANDPAYIDPACIKDLKAFSGGDLGLEHWNDLATELYGENHRASAVLLGSFVESALKSFIRKHGVEGRLRFYDKIEKAYALTLIGPVTRSDLHLIRQIRNEFAHSRQHLNFEIPEVAEACKHLQILQMPDRPKPENLSARERYHTSCDTIVTWMLRNISVFAKRLDGWVPTPLP